LPAPRPCGSSASPGTWLAESAELGVDDVYAFNVNLEQRAYIDAFGAKVLPQLVR
jgi:hypothetical protein